MTDLIASLLDSPVLPRIVARLQHVLAEEAERRAQFYSDLHPDVSAEFINGEVVTQGPWRERHIRCVGMMLTILSTYVQVHKLGRVTAESLTAFTRNDYEPDLCFFGRDKAARITPDTLIFPVPDLAVEVLSESTERRDRGVKFEDYAAHGVAEYWIVDPVAETVEQYVLSGETYALRMKSANGRLAAVAVEDFEVDVRALFDTHANLAALRAIPA